MNLFSLISFAPLILLGLGLFFLPGLALYLAFYPKWRQVPPEVLLPLGIGIGLAIYPLFFLFSKLFVIRVTVSILWMLLTLLGVWLVIFLIKKREEIKSYYSMKLIHIPIENWSFFIGLLLTVSALFFIRSYSIRSLPLPMWGDSVHHTLIVQLLLDNGGLFDSWQPYAEMQSLTYHFGFHAIVATYALLSGLDAAKATLIVGQFLNAFAVLSLSPLAWKISNGNRWATLASWVLAGFVFFMPMYYTNWGRYTQLCGQVLLPIVVFLIWDLLEDEGLSGSEEFARGWLSKLCQRPWKKILLVSLTTSSLALIHYRVFIFMLGSIPILLLFTFSTRYWRNQIVNLGLGGGLGFLLYLPWFAKVYGGKLYEGFVRGVTTSPSAISDYTREYNAIGYLSGYLPLPVWVLFVFCIAWALWRRDQKVLVVPAWWSVVVLMANPNWIGLPGAGLLSNFAVFIAMYIPASLVIGTALTWILEPIRERNTFAVDILGVIALVLTLIFTMRSRLHDIQPEMHAMATQRDIQAMVWIREHTPPETRILVNSFFAYGGSTIVGSDGGWWIPYFTKRKISVPPMPYVSEKGPFPDYVQFVNSLRHMIEEKGYTHPDVIAELKARGYQYAYIGEKQGRVNYTGLVVMKPKVMIESGFYEAVYHKGDVWILRIK